MKLPINFRIVIDTNLWISYLLGSKFVREKMDFIMNNDSYVILFSEALFNELLSVASRPKFLKYHIESRVNELLIFLEWRSKKVKVVSEVAICADVKDNFLLALSTDGKADYLITGDKLLLEMVDFEGTKILSINDFIRDWDGED